MRIVADLNLSNLFFLSNLFCSLVLETLGEIPRAICGTTDQNQIEYFSKCSAQKEITLLW